MLLTFPDLLTFNIFAPLALRLVLGAFFIAAASTRLSKDTRPAFKKDLVSTSIWYAGVVEFVTGVLLILGFLTQIAAAIGLLYALKMLVLRKMESRFAQLVSHDLFTYLFILSSSIAILVLGAGVFAIDLPL